MKVLLIDDNEDLTEAVCDFLDMSGIECKVVNNGRAGLEEILNHKGTYSLILLDIAMPELSGFDVLERLKKEGGQNSSLLYEENIVIFTASSVRDSVIQDYVDQGVKEVLKKPVSIEDLAQLIEKYKKPVDSQK
jgi:two-component system, OmpR family, response regulator